MKSTEVSNEYTYDISVLDIIEFGRFAPLRPGEYHVDFNDLLKSRVFRRAYLNIPYVLVPTVEMGFVIVQQWAMVTESSCTFKIGVSGKKCHWSLHLKIARKDFDFAVDASL